MAEKEYISANELVRDSFLLASRIYESGYRPDVILVLWRGGTPVGVVVHEFLLYKGVETYHTAVKAVSYTGIEKRTMPVIEHMDAVLERIDAGARVLVVDDIFDTGNTLKEVSACLRGKVSDVRFATLYYKEGTNETDIEPDFYLRKTRDWIVFPHELMDLTLDEIRSKDAFVYNLVTGDGEEGC